MTRAVVGASPGYPCHCLVSSQLISSHLKCYIIELSNLGLLLAKTENYVLSTLQIDFKTSLHIYVHLNKVVQTKRAFSKHWVGQYCVWRRWLSCWGATWTRGRCLPPTSARCCTGDDQHQKCRRLVLPAWQQAFSMLRNFSFCVWPLNQNRFCTQFEMWG